MRIIAKASLAFKSEKPSAKPSFGANVITALGGSILFPDLPVTIAELTTVNNALSAAIAAALTGNHTSVAAVKTAVTNWNNDFTLTANYVTSIAQGDETVIRAAGFIPTKSESQPTPKPGASAGFTATINGSKGAIVAASKNAIAEAAGYVYSAVPDGVTVNYNGDTMMITVGDKVIYINADTRRQTEFYHLPSGISYNVSMFAFNRAGTGPAATSTPVIPQ